MSDLIDRELAIELLRTNRPHIEASTKYAMWQFYKDLNAIKTMPSAEKTGKWENIDIIHDRADAKITDWQQAQCSVCGKWQTKPYLYGIKLDPYCPSCGSRMVEE